MFSAPARGSRWGEGAGALASPERGGAARKRGGGVSGGTQNTNWDAPRRIRTSPLLPPLGVVLRAANQDNNDCRWQSYLCFAPRSGKGGGVGNFELLPFNGQHPLSQPCRFRSAVKSASSPIGEPSGLLRIRPGFHKGMSAYRETPLRLAKSRLTAVARLHGACGRTSQAPWACQLSFA